MVFSSPLFLFFFLPITLALTFLFKTSRYKNLLLLCLSVLFYIIGEGELVILMFGSITLNFFIGKWIGNSSGKTAITFGVILNLLIIIIYKYTGFIIENMNPLFIAIGFEAIPKFSIKLPAGISFYTFHSISYLIDVYRKDNKVQKSYVDMALYISLFPQLIAGPIIRYKDIAYQFSRRTFSSARFKTGVERFIIGLGKKAILANTLGYNTDLMFSLNPSDLSTPTAWLAIVSYSLQLYFDFSGYSDMAIGLAKMVGFDFLENFNFPYKAKSIKEFWTRWHISLSNWFRDYLYIPLGGNRVNPFRLYLNLSIVFFLTGLWHGASWNFIIWGMIHGFFMIMERLWLSKILVKTGFFQHIYTLMVVMLAWAFFRIETLGKAMVFLKSLFGINNISSITSDMYLSREHSIALVIALFLSFNVFNEFSRKLVFGIMRSNKYSLASIKMGTRNLKSIGLVLIFIYSCLSVASSSYNPFIYFRF